MQEKVNIFVSYAHKDTALLENFLDHLSILRRLDGIGLWCDIDISAGIVRQDVIEKQLKNSQIILLLVSPAFMASEHCYSQEMKHAVERHLLREVRVIPIILRPVYWYNAPFGELQALPLQRKPVTIWRNRDEAFLHIIEGILKAIKELITTAKYRTNLPLETVKSSKEVKHNIKNDTSHFDVCLVCAKLSEAEILTSIISFHCNVSFEKAFSRRNSYEYYHSTIQNSKGELLTIHVSWQSAYGPADARSHLMSIIKEFNPRFVGMTGVCAGDKRRVKLGDLVIADRAFVYDDSDLLFGREDRLHLQNDMELYHSNIDEQWLVKVYDEWRRTVKSFPRPNSIFQHDLIEEEDSLFRSDSPDLQSVDNKPPHEKKSLPTPYIMPMASVNTVRRDNPFNKMQNLIYPMVAIDMEAASFYQVVAAFPGIHSLVAKGVCDYADPEKNDVYHEYASKVSAIYMLYFLQRYVNSDIV